MAKKYEMPPFMNGNLTPLQYERWLHRMAMAHVKRDRKRGNGSAKGTYR